MSHVKVPMTVEEDAREGLGEMVSGVDRSVHLSKNDQVPFNLFLDGIELDVNVPGSGSRPSSICHCHCTIIVLV